MTLEGRVVVIIGAQRSEPGKRHKMLAGGGEAPGHWWCSVCKHASNLKFILCAAVCVCGLRRSFPADLCL